MYVKAFHRRAQAYEHENKLHEALYDNTAICIVKKFADQEAMQTVDRLLRVIGQSLTLVRMEEMHFLRRTRIQSSIHITHSYTHINIYIYILALTHSFIHLLAHTHTHSYTYIYVCMRRIQLAPNHAK